MKPSTKIPGRKKNNNWCSISIDKTCDAYRISLLPGVSFSPKNKSQIKISVDNVIRKDNEERKKLLRLQHEINNLLSNIHEENKMRTNLTICQTI